MKDQSKKLPQQMCLGIPECTSSAALPCGTMPSTLLAGEIKKSGRAPLRASRGQPLETVGVQMTLDISGQTGSSSFGSVALLQSLGNRLVQRMALHGSIWYTLTWKVKATPSRRLIFRLHASVRRMSGKESTLLRPWEKTPHASDGEGGIMEIRPGTRGHYKLRDYAQLATWPTPTVDDANNATRISGQYQSLTRTAGWATPAARDYRFPNRKSYQERSNSKKGEQLNNQVVHQTSGEILNGCSAQMENIVLLNPEFVRWLLGLPEEWGNCAPMGTR